MEEDNKEMKRERETIGTPTEIGPDASYLVVHFGIQVAGVENKLALARLWPRRCLSGTSASAGLDFPRAKWPLGSSWSARKGDIGG